MKLIVNVRTRFIKSQDQMEIEISDEDLEGLTQEERDAEIEKQAKEAMFSMIEWDWQEVK